MLGRTKGTLYCIVRVKQYTKDLVHADRISLFLVDKEKHELYIDIFDEGIKDSIGKAMFKRSAEIRYALLLRQAN